MRNGHSTTDNFFAVQKTKSKIKTIIVTEFLKAYFPIINSKFKKDIWYIDLFCGPGCYEDGSKSTPVVLLDVIGTFTDDAVCNRLHIVFNDRNADYISKLKSNISGHPILPRMRYQPRITNLNASEVDLSCYTKGNNPIFSFIDPWGYKDISSSQVWELVKNVGSDCVLFFNADRILQDIGKPANEEDFRKLFGNFFEEAKSIQPMGTMTQRQKAEKFLMLFSKNLYLTVRRETGNYYRVYVLPFYVEADDKEKISHFIVFISKNHKAIREMRKVMIKHGNSTSTMLGYDDKDAFQLTLLSRNDDLYNSIFPIIKACFSQFPQLYEKEFTIDNMAETVDNYSMYTQYKVLPYSSSDLKQVIEILDKFGCIDVIPPKGKRMVKRITLDRQFKILRAIEDV